MQECVFCELGKNGREKIFENDFFISVFDAFPVSAGHALIIPKRHVVNIADLTPEEWAALRKTITEVVSVIEKTDLIKIYQGFIDKPASDLSVWFCRKAIGQAKINKKPDAYNHGVNDGRAAGRTIDHLHWHVIPRFEGDMADPRGGVRYVIPEMGNYKIIR